MTSVFPDNTPLYIRLKYQFHAGVACELQSRNNFIEFLFKEAYWYGEASCPVAIKLSWLESQSWAQELFDEVPLSCGDITISFFKPAKLFYSTRKDLTDRYSLKTKGGLTGYLFDIYFGGGAQEYYISLPERMFLSRSSTLMVSQLMGFQFCNAFYLIYTHNVHAHLSIDINTKKGQKLFVAYLFINSKTWINKVESTVVNQFFVDSGLQVIECVRLLFGFYDHHTDWGDMDIVSYLRDNKHSMHICQGMLERLISLQRDEGNKLSPGVLPVSNASVFRKILHSADGELHAEYTNILNIYGQENSNRKPEIVDEIKSFLEKNYGEKVNYNAGVKRALVRHAETINPELLQYFIAHCISFSPFEIYVPTEAFGLDDSTSFSDSNEISIVGFSRSEIGTGEDTRNTVKALSLYGYTVSVFNIIPDAGAYTHQEATDRRLEIQRLGNVQIYTMPPMIYMSQFLVSPPIHDAKGYKIGYFAWEFSEWKDEYDSIFELFDEIWVISKFLIPAFSGKGLPVQYVPPVVILRDDSYLECDIRAELALPRDKFLFLFVFDIKSSAARKNPMAVIRGFLSAFPGDSDVGLVLKFTYDEHDYNNNRDLFALINEDERIYHVADMLSKPKIEALIHRCDVVVSLHRSEGFGRIIAESMLLKTLVICTAFSGNMDYCSDETALLVDYDLAKVGPGEYPFAEGLVWADVKHKSVVEQMINARRDSDENRSRIEEAYTIISQNHSIESAADVMMQRLDEVCLFDG